VDDFSVLFPSIPESGKSKGLSACQPDEIGNLAVLDFLPLIETAGQNQTSLAMQETLETGLLVDGFSVGIDHLVSDFLVFGP
jgi:hypothetical protein